MKKRMIALMLAGIMVLSVTACGGGGASSKNQNNQDDGESKQVGVEVTEDMQSAPPEDAPVGGQVVVAISPGTTGYVRRMVKQCNKLRIYWIDEWLRPR